VRRRAGGRLLARATAAVLLAALAVAGAACRRPAPATRDVVLISLDALRADRLGAYGYSLPTSPFLDHLAARGLTFERAFVNTHGTTPSHTTLLSGLYQENHGVGLAGSRGGVVATAIPPGVPWLPELLRARGYQTIGVTDGGNIGRRFGFARGFDRFDDRGGGLRRGARRLLAEVQRARRADPRRPLFLFLHTYQVHSPYHPPADLRRLFGVPADVRQASSRFLVAHASDAAALPPGVQATLSSLYDADIRHTDDLLRELFADLAGEGLLAHALVVVTADHGEEFGEHGGLLHRDLLYDELLHVPLLLAAPGIAPARVGGLVSTVDVAPTILAWAGAPAPPGLPGRDLLRAAGQRRALVLAQYGRERYCVRTAEWKLIVSDGRAELYDLRRDPREQRDVAASHADVRQRLAAALGAWQAERRAQGTAPAGRAVELPAEERAQLRALGYLRH
jgi:arylsulfatase A-like enzyme